MAAIHAEDHMQLLYARGARQVIETVPEKLRSPPTGNQQHIAG
jgi:hypothetical protein